MDNIKYIYQFEFKTGRKEKFQRELDNKTKTPINNKSDELPDWTKLEFLQCPNCPLSLKITHCPLAVQLAPLVDTLKDVISIEETHVTVTMNDRITSNETTAQEGISSMMGVITAVSGCPLTEFFKPMARFHLPFANIEETFYRATSMYMLGQFYRWQDNLSADMELKGLAQFYTNIAMVNKSMANRLKANQRKDGAINALVILDMFAKSVPDAVDDLLAELKPLFKSYLNEQHIF
jgi:hypothetical protein